MGLGLPIVKRTVFDHNGRVDVDSNSHGTSVSVLLPVLENGELIAPGSLAVESSVWAESRVASSNL